MVATTPQQTIEIGRGACIDESFAVTNYLSLCSALDEPARNCFVKWNGLHRSLVVCIEVTLTALVSFERWRFGQCLNP